MSQAAEESVPASVEGPTVVIGVATHLRPRGLERLLKGFDALTFGSRAPKSIIIVVVDNDPAQSAAAVCAARGETGRWPLVYVAEPRRGIPFARNTVVFHARSLGAELLAFIDDDEVPEPPWLDELLRVMRESGADVVTGPVLPAFEGEVPPWIQRGGFFDRERHATGSFQHRATTNNVVLRLELLAGMPAPFDERRPLSGGTDSHLFRGIILNGHRIAWADDAVVYEWNPASRLTARWLVRRAYRVSSNWSSSERELQPGFRVRAARIAKAIGRMAQGLALLPVGIIAGRHVLVRASQLVATGAGYLAGMAGYGLEEYRVTHGS